jgi:hypothetical protein
MPSSSEPGAGNNAAAAHRRNHNSARLRDARTQALPRYLKGACLISAAAALGLAAYEIAVAIKLWRVLPVDDQWEAVTIYQDWAAGTLSPARLLAQHNEHRLPLTRLAFLVDFGLFRGRSTFVHALLLLSHIGLGTALGLVAAHGRTAVERVLAIAAGIAFLVSPIQLQNLTAPFHLNWAACGLFALGAFFWTARLAAGTPDAVDRPAAIASAAVATMLAVYSSANGLAAALIVLAAALVLPVGRTARLVLPATAILAIASYLVGYGAPPYHEPFHAVLRSAHGVAQFLIYIPTLLGSIAQRFGRAEAAVPANGCARAREGFVAGAIVDDNDLHAVGETLRREPAQGVAQMNAAVVVDNEDADGRIFRHGDVVVLNKVRRSPAQRYSKNDHDGIPAWVARSVTCGRDFAAEGRVCNPPLPTRSHPHQQQGRAANPPLPPRVPSLRPPLPSSPPCISHCSDISSFERRSLRRSPTCSLTSTRICGFVRDNCPCPTTSGEPTASITWSGFAC